MIKPTGFPSMTEMHKSSGRASSGGAAAVKADSLRVLVRVRPPISIEVQHDGAIHTDAYTVSVRNDKHDVTCQYDKVFGETSTQAQVFDEIVPLLRDVLLGYNACIFAYGQTSSGKTHTMLGPDGGRVELMAGSKQKWGVLPRAADMLFTELERKASEGSLNYKVTASFLQIYNESIYDLLRKSSIYNDDFDESSAEYLKIREIPKGKGSSATDAHEVFVSGLSEFRVQTAIDVLQIIALGSANRATRSTDYNATSSRSHAILQLNFEITNNDSTTDRQTISKSKLSLVDLAGSEKMQTSQDPTEKHLKELTSINKSLSSLGNVISALSSVARSHVPYRDSKLTRLLQDSLGGNTRTVLIACVAPTVLHVAESLSTLQFADRAKSVMLKVRANTMVDDKAQLASANNEVLRLKQLLQHALRRAEGGKDNDGESGSGSLLQENMQLREENDRLREEIMAYEAMFTQDSGTIERDRRGRVKPPKNKALKQLLKPVKARANAEMLRAMVSSHSASPLKASDTAVSPPGPGASFNLEYDEVQIQEEQNRVLNFGPGRVRPKYDTSANGMKKSGSAKVPVLHPLRNSGLYGEGAFRSSAPTNPDASTQSSSLMNRADERDPQESLVSTSGPFCGGDISMLRQKMARPKSKAQLRELSKSIIEADYHTQQQLQEEAASLSSIQAMKRSLERQLAAIKTKPAVAEERERLADSQEQQQNYLKQLTPNKGIGKSSSNRVEQINHINLALKAADEAGFGSRSMDSLDGARYEDDFEPSSPSKSSPARSSPSRVKMSSLTKPAASNQAPLSISPLLNSIVYSPSKTASNASYEFASPAVADPAAALSRTGTAIVNAAGLHYDARDIGVIFEMFAFRYTSWEPVEVLDFEASKMLHRCRMVDGSAQWLDLKKKPIRKKT